MLNNVMCIYCVQRKAVTNENDAKSNCKKKQQLSQDRANFMGTLHCAQQSERECVLCSVYKRNYDNDK